MKLVLSILLFSFSCFNGLAQNLDSLLSIPSTLELKMSNPQPRLKEQFQFTVDINVIRAQIFKSAIGKLEFANNEIGGTDNDLMKSTVIATQKGKQEIGPLSFTINGTPYTTNKIEYEVIDALPDIDDGLWFRKVVIDSSKFCIIIEQRIPAHGHVTKISDNTTRYSTEPIRDQLTKFKDYYPIEGLDQGGGSSTSETKSLYDKNGKQKSFLSGFSITYFTITDKTAKIRITKDRFDNIPADYTFEDIVVQ